MMHEEELKREGCPHVEKEGSYGEEEGGIT
jgi:hypothetical protein